MSPKPKSAEIGAAVERLAEAWYVSRFPEARLVARNFFCKVGELDLVFEEKGELVFVEVRGRARGAQVGGIESVTHTKRRRLGRAIGCFLARYRGAAHSARVDVLELEMDGKGGGTWRHLPNVRLD